MSSPNPDAPSESRWRKVTAFTLSSPNASETSIHARINHALRHLVLPDDVLRRLANAVSNAQAAQSLDAHTLALNVYLLYVAEKTSTLTHGWGFFLVERRERNQLNPSLIVEERLDIYLYQDR